MTTPAILKQIREIAAVNASTLDQDTKKLLVANMNRDLQRMTKEYLAQGQLPLSPGTVEDKGATVPGAKKPA